VLSPVDAAGQPGFPTGSNTIQDGGMSWISVARFKTPKTFFLTLALSSLAQCGRNCLLVCRCLAKLALGSRVSLAAVKLTDVLTDKPSATCLFSMAWFSLIEHHLPDVTNVRLILGTPDYVLDEPFTLRKMHERIEKHGSLGRLIAKSDSARAN
jgi:hypothetical protein